MWSLRISDFARFLRCAFSIQEDDKKQSITFTSCKNETSPKVLTSLARFPKKLENKRKLAGGSNELCSSILDIREPLKG